MRAILFFIVFFLAHSAQVSAQALPSASPTPNDGRTNEDRRREVQRQQAEQEGFNRLRNLEMQRNNSRQGIGLSNRQSLPFKASITKEQRLHRAPDAGLLFKYASFLKQSGTGLIKLFPDLGCEANANILRADSLCLNWIPNSAFYSFRKKEHTSEMLSDLIYKNGFLVTDGILSQGIMVAVGDVPLENVSLSTEGIKFLLEYKPELLSKDAFNQFIQISNGVKDGKFEYRKAIPAVENTTYLIRVIAYKGNFYNVYRGWQYDVLYGDKRLDLTLAFRVLRREENGNITLLWKELARKEAPRVIFPKKEKKKDVKPTDAVNKMAR